MTQDWTTAPPPSPYPTGRFEPQAEVAASAPAAFVDSSPPPPSGTTPTPTPAPALQPSLPPSLPPPTSAPVARPATNQFGTPVQPAATTTNQFGTPVHPGAMTTNQFGTPMSQVGAPVPADQQWSSTPVRHSKVGAAGGQIVVRLLVGLVVVGFGAVVRSHLAAPAPSIEGVAPGSCIHVVAGQVASGVLSDIAPIECGKPDSHVVLATGSMSGVPLSATAIEARIHKVAPSITEGIYVYDRERWVLVES